MKATPFPSETFAHGVDTTAVHSFATPLHSREQIAERVEVYKGKEGIETIRVARYVLQSVDVVWQATPKGDDR